MVITETMENGLIHTYTTEPETKQLKQLDTGFIYDDAIDAAGTNHTYIEVSRNAEE